MTEEIWKMHPCGLEVSSMGRVKVPQGKRGKKEHITFGSDDGKGYKKVRCQGKLYLVHRLVAEAFIPNTENKPEVDHISQRRDENQVDNLRWATRVEQMNFEDQDVKERIAKKKTNGKTSKPVLQCDFDNNIIKMWSSTMECQRNGYNSGAVAACCNNRFHRQGNNVYKGYIWRYA